MAGSCFPIVPRKSSGFLLLFVSFCGGHRTCVSYLVMDISNYPLSIVYMEMNGSIVLMSDNAYCLIYSCSNPRTHFWAFWSSPKYRMYTYLSPCLSNYLGFVPMENSGCFPIVFISSQSLILTPTDITLLRKLGRYFTYCTISTISSANLKFNKSQFVSPHYVLWFIIQFDST